MVILFFAIFLVGALSHPVPAEEKETSAAEQIGGDDQLQFTLSEISENIVNLIDFLEVLGKNSSAHFHDCPTEEDLVDNIPHDNDLQDIVDNNTLSSLTQYYIKYMEGLNLLKNLHDRFHLNGSDVNQHFNIGMNRLKVILVSLDHLSITLLHLLKQYMSDSIGKALIDRTNVSEMKPPAFHSKEIKNEIPCLVMYALKKLKEIDINMSIKPQNIESNLNNIKENFQINGKKVTNDDIASPDAKFTTEPMTTSGRTSSDDNVTKYLETPTSSITSASEVTDINKFDKKLSATVAMTSDTTSISTITSDASQSFVTHTTNSPANDLMINSNIFTSISSYESTINTESQIKTRPSKHIST